MEPRRNSGFFVFTGLKSSLNSFVTGNLKVHYLSNYLPKPYFS
jgi:hypothetical protein